tara:strand:- start:81 stop:761 length:681 start_codon:yes stop_codon:yes gene_type:complete
MTFIGLYIIVFLIISELYNFNKINLGILIGIIIPDLDLILKYFNIHSSYHGSILHSILFMLIFYISLLIINELNKKIINNIIINGIFLGMLLHIILDIILSSGSILFYWPLPISPIEPLYSLYTNNNILYLLGCVQLLLLRYFGHKMIIKILNKNNPSEKFYFSINLISYWMRFQTTVLLSFILMYFFKIEFSTILMDFCMLASMLTAIYFLYKTRELTNEDIIIG